MIEVGIVVVIVDMPGQRIRKAEPGPGVAMLGLWVHCRLMVGEPAYSDYKKMNGNNTG